MALDWSLLPKDLLQLISKKLNSEFHQTPLSFRLFIMAFFHSQKPTPPPQFTFQIPNPFQLPQFYHHLPSLRTISFTHHTPHNQTLNHHPWLIKIGPDSRDQTRLWNPLSRDNKLPLQFPQSIDSNLLLLSVIYLGHEFVIGNFPYQSSQNYSISLNSMFMKKVVVYHIHTLHRYALLTIHISGKLAIFPSGDENWKIIPEMSSPYNDVCVFNGRPIAVDSTGRAVAVGPDLSLDLVAEAVFGGDKKLLVESDGELLLVDKYVNCLGNCILDERGEEFYEIGIERAVKFQVFRLDEKEKKWVEVRNLGDRVLFMGEDSAFSALASDLGVGNGNCVIFRDDVYRYVNSTGLGISVFCLDTCQISPLSNFPHYSKLFWPPLCLGLKGCNEPFGANFGNIADDCAHRH